MNKGWFALPNRPGDRTLQEQMLGLDKALAECKGRAVLDIGCAEGLISVEFAKAGASSVLGIELLSEHLKMARVVAKPYPQVEFLQAHLGDYAAKLGKEPPQYDIVLALGIIHKLHDPCVGLRFAAMSCRDLLAFRAPAKATGDYIVKSKFTAITCNVPKEMRAYGFEEEGVFKGVRGEAVQYWRRRK